MKKWKVSTVGFVYLLLSTVGRGTLCGPSLLLVLVVHLLLLLHVDCLPLLSLRTLLVNFARVTFGHLRGLRFQIY